MVYDFTDTAVLNEVKTIGPLGLERGRSIYGTFVYNSLGFNFVSVGG